MGARRTTEVPVKPVAYFLAFAIGILALSVIARLNRKG